MKGIKTVLLVILMIRMFVLFTDSVSAEEEAVTLTVLFRYDFEIPDAFDQVAEQIDRYVQEKIGVSIDLIALLPGNQAQQVELLQKEGTLIDVSSGLCGKFDFLPLDDLLLECGQDILAIATEEELEITKMDGILYSLPSKADYTASAGIAMRRDILEECMIDPDTIKSLEDVDKVLDIVHQQKPQMHLVSPLWTTGGFLLRYHMYEGISNTVFDFTSVDSDEIVNIYRTEGYRQKLRLFRKWYLQGYLPEELPFQRIKGS